MSASSLASDVEISFPIPLLYFGTVKVSERVRVRVRVRIRVSKVTVGVRVRVGFRAG
jgi:hypothetical protein